MQTNKQIQNDKQKNKKNKGVGSVCFHGTLRFHVQLLDEVPMVLGVFCFTYVIIDTERIKPRKWIAYLCLAAAILEVIHTHTKKQKQKNKLRFFEKFFVCVCAFFLFANENHKQTTSGHPKQQKRDVTF